ncbi:SH3 domain-containing protein [Streptomyces sp. NPDC052415]|uniref:SH3 domain-containing protein n=1 Tax=Streptomyces sp. NPDC052415 TaxID=3365690 RepID=UPI0037D79E06
MRLPSRVVAVISAALMAASGAVLATAPTAAAVSIPSARQYPWNTPHNAKTTASVNLRTGPRTGYVSLGTLSKATTFTHFCLAYAKGTNWA